ncbi:hypothetical protein DCAR_0832378 [Daucus carota subsp. sativus]|uniref:non-specific serine/threonine protein kinase n=1 Tax=Daucus carota subsp. sativus TaxID=79200 RepID=A0AAF0XTJ3_DAUCS|nr:hypothetical protein DCAR_0832378 [Daucus carota subsp. sativus]
MSTLVIFVFIILNIIVYKLCELHETECSEKDEAFVIPSGERFHRFSLAEILLATNSFDEKCLIGKGGSARVYKGMIDNGGTPVAIKRLSFVNKRCGGSMFWTEIQMLSKLRHSHLVSLVGYCDEQNEMILVFEYIPCGTLSDHLHRSFEKGYYTLSWIERLRICIGAARGLDYLHTGTSIHQRVIHRDVKTTNILLDDHLEAKIADFGISKIVTANQGCTYVSTAVKGTFGYMDPSYFVTGRLTRKSDVYAFGVVLFEVLSGRRAVDLSRDDKQYKQFGLAGWAQTCIRQGRIIEIVDSTLKSEISKESLLAFVRIAYRCLNGQPDCRPTMAEIVVVLEFALALQENPEFTRFEGKSGSNSPPHLAAVEVAYGEDQAKYSGRDQMILWPGHICRRFSLAEILCATHNFDDKCLTGKGGSAKVYKGILDNGATTVAIKRLNFTSKQAGRAVFWTEIEMLSKFRHGHLVSLVGYCDEWHEMILVFEYVPGGTLSDHLHKAFEKGYYTLSWIQRLRICIGAAQGLDYLHTGTGIHQRVIHRDVKSTNILLDDKLEAKIADFGISKIVAANQGCTYISTAVRGTFGYMDPAYFSTGRLTRKSDVYAFGVVLFEVLCGRRAVDLSRDDEQSEGRIIEIIDSNLNMQISRSSLLAFVNIACQCLNSQPSCRPTMAEIVVVLEFALALQQRPDDLKGFEGTNADYGAKYSTAVEMVYGADQNKAFKINRSRVTFSRKVCQILSATIRTLSG